MTSPEDAQLVSRAAGSKFNYNRDITAIRDPYELKCIVFAEHFKVWTLSRLITQHRKDITKYSQRLRLPLNASDSVELALSST